MTIELQGTVDAIPEALAEYGLKLNGDGTEIEYAYDREAERTGITSLVVDLPGRDTGSGAGSRGRSQRELPCA